MSGITQTPPHEAPACPYDPLMYKWYLTSAVGHIKDAIWNTNYETADELLSLAKNITGCPKKESITVTFYQALLHLDICKYEEFHECMSEAKKEHASMLGHPSLIFDNLRHFQCLRLDSTKELLKLYGEYTVSDDNISFKFPAKVSYKDEKRLKHLFGKIQGLLEDKNPKQALKVIKKLRSMPHCKNKHLIRASVYEALANLMSGKRSQFKSQMEKLTIKKNIELSLPSSLENKFIKNLESYGTIDPQSNVFTLTPKTANH